MSLRTNFNKKILSAQKNLYLKSLVECSLVVQLGGTPMFSCIYCVPSYQPVNFFMGFCHIFALAVWNHHLTFNMREIIDYLLFHPCDSYEPQNISNYKFSKKCFCPPGQLGQFPD